VYLDLVYCSFPEMVGVNVAERPLLRFDWYHPEYILICKIRYFVGQASEAI
jgi:hypothetical protein